MWPGLPLLCFLLLHSLAQPDEPDVIPGRTTENPTVCDGCMYICGLDAVADHLRRKLPRRGAGTGPFGSPGVHGQTPPPPNGTDNTKPVGENPIKIQSVRRLGFQNAVNSCSHRDLGFTGRLAGNWYAIYGDTLWCAPGVTDPDSDPPGFHGLVRDSVSLMTEDPLKVIDLNLNDDQPVPHQRQFVPFVPEWGETNTFGFGGTSLCEVDEAKGVGALYYLVNSNETGLIGAGVAQVTILNGTPTVTHRFGDRGYWWDARTAPRYGDIAAYRDEKGEYIYLWGNPPTSVTGWVNGSYVYLARVRADRAFDLSSYEYFWGRQQGWKREVLDTLTPETAVWWGTGQGQVFWSPFYECYVLVHLGIGGATVSLRTAWCLEGPWTPDEKVYIATPISRGLVYAGVAHPYLDPAGRTLVLSYTNNNHIEVIKVEFKAPEDQ